VNPKERDSGGGGMGGLGDCPKNTIIDLFPYRSEPDRDLPWNCVSQSPQVT